VLSIGLTGGIASGKSTVAGMFEALGAEIIDTDQIARELVAPGSQALGEIVAVFGGGLLADDGSLDRRRLREIVFADIGRRRRLEAILHPLIRRETLARIDNSQAPYTVVVVPLLFETGFNELVDRTVVVDCPQEVQIDRLTVRDSVSRDEAISVISSQMPREERLSLADDTIDSTLSLDATRQRVAELDAKFRSLAQNCPKVEGRAE